LRVEGLEVLGLGFRVSGLGFGTNASPPGAALACLDQALCVIHRVCVIYVYTYIYIYTHTHIYIYVYIYIYIYTCM
jgi:hypothetical protein